MSEKAQKHYKRCILGIFQQINASGNSNKKKKRLCFVKNIGSSGVFLEDNTFKPSWKIKVLNTKR